MQQYFSDIPLHVGDEYIFTDEQAHHARDVVRLREERIRLVCAGKGFFARTYRKGKQFAALVEEEDSRTNESGIDLTLVMALIRREKFELVLQKATELGVNRIVPMISSRCVVKAREEKAEKQRKRWQDICLEAAQQCKRSRIPEVTETIRFSDLEQYKSEASLAAYENAWGTSSSLSRALKGKKSVTVVIGPEGGFSNEEMTEFDEMGYQAVTFGPRILRAETAAMYACAIVSEAGEEA